MKNIESLIAQIVRENQGNPQVIATAEELRNLARRRLSQGKFVEDVNGLIPDALHYRHPGFEYDGERREITRGEQRFSLTNIESILLESLLRNANEIVARSHLATLISPEGDIPDDVRIVNVHMSHLRRKLRGEDVAADPIRTIQKVGYMFVDPSRPIPAEPPAPGK